MLFPGKRPPITYHRLSVSSSGRGITAIKHNFHKFPLWTIPSLLSFPKSSHHHLQTSSHYPLNSITNVGNVHCTLMPRKAHEDSLHTHAISPPHWCEWPWAHTWVLNQETLATPLLRMAALFITPYHLHWFCLKESKFWVCIFLRSFYLIRAVGYRTDQLRCLWNLKIWWRRLTVCTPNLWWWIVSPLITTLPMSFFVPVSISHLKNSTVFNLPDVFLFF